MTPASECGSRSIGDPVAIDITAPVDAVPECIAGLFAEDEGVCLADGFYASLTETPAGEERRLSAVVAAVVASVSADEDVIDAISIAVHATPDGVADPVSAAALIRVVWVAVRVVLALTVLTLKSEGRIGR